MTAGEWRHLQGFFGPKHVVALVTVPHGDGSFTRWLADPHAMLDPLVLGSYEFTSRAGRPDGYWQLRADRPPADVTGGFDPQVRALTPQRVAWVLDRWDSLGWAEVKPSPWALVTGAQVSRMLLPDGGGPPMFVGQDRWARWSRPLLRPWPGELRFWACADRSVVKVTHDQRTVGYVLGVRRPDGLPVVPDTWREPAGV